MRIVEGELPISAVDPRAFTPDELRDGWRLACRAQASCDLVIDVPPLQTRPKAATVGVGRQVILRPSVQKRYLELAEPTLQDQASDLERILAAMDDLELRVGVDVVRTLPQLVRAAEWRLTAVVVDDELVGVEAGDTTARMFGIAFDLGTTTVVATLLDLSTGTPAAVRSILNRQQPYGADVIRRISATMMDPTVLPKLQELAQGTLADLVAEVLEQGEVSPDEVYEVALAGNATMTQLLLGIDPEPVGVAPFIMAASSYPLMRASDFGVTVHPRAHAHVFPALGAYVGGDIVSGLLASGMTRDKRLRLFIDVGTNCEIALGNVERLLTTAAPAGPAFEAAQIRCGMRAADGAIETVRIADDEVALGVIGDATPVGICGSGLVDAVAELVKCGLLDSSGRFIPDEQAAERYPVLAERLVAIEGERIFVLAWAGEPGDPEGAVYLSQRDVRELQFAKASIATGWALLVEELGVKVADIQQVLLAGSFGSYLLAGLCRAHRARAEACAAAHRRGRQRRRRGREDDPALGPGARRGGRARARGRVRRALRPARLQRPLHRPARLPVVTVGVVACGALALHVQAIARRRGLDVDVHALPPQLHNRPERIAPAVTAKLAELSARHGRVAVAYADCGSYGALDAALAGTGIERLRRRHVLRPLRPRRGARRAGGGAGHVFPHRLPGTHVRAHGVALARPRPLSRAARRLLPLLSPLPLALAAADAVAAHAPPSTPPRCSGCR